MKRIYIVKNLTPWMMDELQAFSEKVDFELILLRNPDPFYQKSLDVLKLNDITVETPISGKNLSLKKLKTVIWFSLRNIGKIGFDYNLAIWLKSAFWFLNLDLNKFSKTSSLHAQFATQPSLVSLMIKEHFDGEPQISMTFHAYDIYFKNNWLKLLLANSFKAFSISSFNIRYVEENFGSSDNMLLSRLGVFKERIKIDRTTKSETFTLGFMSWFVEKKGIMYLLEACKYLIEVDDIPIKLKLGGDGPLKEAILEFISKFGLEDQIEYLGKVKNEDKDQFYNSLDAFVLPSISLKKDQDGIPVVLMEAIAYGLPIVSTDVSGIPEICMDDYNGYLIEEKSVEEIVQAIIKLYKSPSKRESFSKNSLEVSKTFDIRKNSLYKLEQLNWI